MSARSVRGGWLRAIGARLLTVVGVLLVVVSIAANFVERQALGKDDFEETARQLIADPTIQNQVASTLTDELFSSVDVRAELASRLPEDQQGLAGPVAGALRPLSERLARELLERPRFQQVWVAALVAAQQQVVRVLDDKARFLETEGGVVSIDLRPLLVELTKELPVIPDFTSKLPPNTGVITIFEAEELDAAQKATRLLRFVADWIWVLALAAWIGAVYLARDRRKEVRAIALGLVIAGVLLLLIQRAAEGYLVDKLSNGPSQEEATRRTWEILTRLLADAGWAVIGLGLVALVGVWLIGPSRRGSAARQWLAPHLRRPEIAFGGAAFVYLLLLVWGPISYVRKPSTILVLAALLALGVEALRRKAARDFPDATVGAVRIPIGRRGAPNQADELERLAQLHADGRLSDDEFAAAKARVLAPP